MKVIAVLSTLLLSAVLSFAADAIRLKLESATLKPGSGNSEHLGVGDDGRLFFYSGLTAEWKVKVPAAGEYTLRVSASCDAAQGTNANFKVLVNDQPAGDEVKLTTEAEKEYTLKVQLKQGEQKLGIAFSNDVYKEGEYDRNLFLHSISLVSGK